MLETKAITVAPEEEQGIIDLVANFGWSLKSSQEVNNTDSHLENRGGDIYNVTTKEHYVKLIFERDNKMENYKRITELEATYYDIMGREPVMENIKISPVITIIGLIIYVVPGALYLAYKIWRKSKAKKDFDEAYAAWSKEKAVALSALAESRSLV